VTRIAPGAPASNLIDPLGHYSTIFIIVFKRGMRLFNFPAIIRHLLCPHLPCASQVKHVGGGALPATTLVGTVKNRHTTETFSVICCEKSRVVLVVVEIVSWGLMASLPRRAVVAWWSWWVVWARRRSWRGFRTAWACASATSASTPYAAALMRSQETATSSANSL
jgi:hypothetical protein